MIDYSFVPSTRREYNIPNCDAELAYVEKCFLIELLEKYNPKKVVEIGVSAGGTSCIILKNSSPKSEVYGVDVAEKFYCDHNKTTGYNIEDFCSADEKMRHTLLLGKDVIDQLDIIGGDIDFCFLDTTHSMPGEMLSFFAIYKSMKKGAVLVMHDISLNFLRHTSPETANAFTATRILFSVLGSHKKMLPKLPIPNIGALIIDEETEQSIESAFCALGVNWFYYPNALMERYKFFIDKNYSKFCANMFDQCIKLQKEKALQIW